MINSQRDKAPRDYLVAAEYRKKMVSDLWHFCSNCSRWPKDHYVATVDVPNGNSMCQECVVRKQRGECH